MIIINLFLLLLNSANATMKVVVLDTGLDLNDSRVKSHLCLTGHYDATKEGLKDTNGHGTFVAGLIIQYSKQSDYCLIVVKAFDQYLSDKAYLKGLTYAVTQNPDVINMSSGGETINPQEALIISNNPSITFIVAAGNNAMNLDKKGNNFYPASYNYNNIISVGSKKNNVVSSTSNYGSVVDRWENGERVESYAIGNGYTVMSGTSFSTAIQTGKYIYEIFKKSN